MSRAKQQCRAGNGRKQGTVKIARDPDANEPKGIPHDHVRHRRRGRRSNIVPVLIEGCAGSNTAATTRPASRVARRRAPASGCARAARVADSTRSANATARSPARTGICAHALGDARRADDGQRASAYLEPRRTGDRLVHNGIIENYERSRARLKAQGYMFDSQTDTEVIAHLIHSLMTQGATCSRGAAREPRSCRAPTRSRFISNREPGVVVGARKGSPLLVGSARARTSSPPMRSRWSRDTRRSIYLEEGDVADIAPRPLRDRRPQRHAASSARCTTSRLSADAVELGPYATTCRRKSSSSRARSPTRSRWWPTRIAAARLVRRAARESIQRDRQCADPRLRHQLLRRAGRKYWLEALAGLPTAGRDRERIPLPRQRAASRRAGGDDFAVGRDRRHARRAEARAVARAPHTLAICNVARVARWCARSSCAF